MLNTIHSNYNSSYNTKLNFSNKNIVNKNNNSINTSKSKIKANLSNDIQPKNYQDEITYLYENNLLNDCIDSNDKFDIKKIADKCGLNFEDCTTDDLHNFISGLAINKLCSSEEYNSMRSSVGTLVTYYEYSQNALGISNSNKVNAPNVNFKSFLKSQMSNFILWGDSTLAKEYEDILKIIS